MKMFARDLPIWESDAHSPPPLLLSKPVPSVWTTVRHKGTAQVQRKPTVKFKSKKMVVVTFISKACNPGGLDRAGPVTR